MLGFALVTLDIHVAPNNCAWRFLFQQNKMEIINTVEQDVASYDAIEVLGTCTIFGLLVDPLSGVPGSLL